MPWTDEELVARSISGDADSFNELVLRWERPIYALAYRTIGREEDARDVCQETFLRAFRALPGFRGQAKFSSWLYRIALNLCRDWMRRERRTPVVQAPEDVDLMELAAAAEPSESIEDLVARKDLTRARRARDGVAAGGAADGDRVEGVPRADVPGDRGSGRLPVEHGEDAVVSGVDGVAARAREEQQSKAMTDSFCGYQGDRDEALVAFLYDDGGDARERGLFEAHLMTCPRCSDELAALRGVRAQLARWAPPEPAFAVSNLQIRNQQSAMVASGPRVGPGGGGAAVPRRVRGDREPRREVRRERPERPHGLDDAIFARHAGQRGRDPRRGRVSASGVAPPGTAAAPWRADLAALERQLDERAPGDEGVHARGRRQRRTRRSCAAFERCSTRARSASSASSRCAWPK